ncbi:hypothetical protein [Methanosphaerula palustris]|uniref:Uncharacterized protein n=1 Tax=Methanosphaerula palustris (strain ATCC BAA-1556 / DSM 19958 / E1-9c) TaxID=521011 RepID=B8GFZ7_METPE|nr:hypothetical protein [Methanosphaerula palustris]ACL18030.1 hypothetical protein Mpal_2774 [Methanosphaerula palustris E1-9c]
MAKKKRRTDTSLDTSLFKRAMAYGAENGLSLSDLIEQGLRLRLDGPPVPAEESSLSASPPHLEALVDRRIQEQLPHLVQAWLESARGEECPERLIVPHVLETAEAVDMPLEAAVDIPSGTVDIPLGIVERLQQQRMIQLEKTTGVDIPTLHLIRLGKQTRLPKETMEKLVAGLELVESNPVSDYELEGMHG